MGTCQELCRMLIFYTNCWKCYSVTPLSAEVSENVRSFCPVCAKHWNCQEKRPQQKHFNANGPLPTGVHRKGQNLSLSTFSNAIEALNVALGAGVSFLRNPPFYLKKTSSPPYSCQKMLERPYLHNQQSEVTKACDSREASAPGCKQFMPSWLFSQVNNKAMGKGVLFLFKYNIYGLPFFHSEPTSLNYKCTFLGIKTSRHLLPPFLKEAHVRSSPCASEKFVFNVHSKLSFLKPNSTVAL